MRMSAYDRWATQGPPDELDYLEHEAREQGEADIARDILARGICLECFGDGFLPADGYGDQAGGWADTCQECKGTGKDLRGCGECGLGHDIQACPAIKTLLMQEDT